MRYFSAKSALRAFNLWSALECALFVVFPYNMNCYLINLDKSQFILCKAIKPPTYLRRYDFSKADYVL